MGVKKDVNLPDDLIKALWEGHQSGKALRREIADDIKRAKTTITDLLRIILTVGSLPAEVCLHTRFGVRYLNLGTVIAGLLFLEIPKHLLGEDAVSAGWIAQGVFLLLSLVHMAHPHLAEQAGNIWHSRSPGRPWPIWQMLPRQQTPFDVQRVVEPVLAVVAGIAIATANECGAFVIALGVILFLKQAVIFHQHRKQMLDQRDSMIEAEVMNEQEGGERSMWDNKGYVVPSEIFRWRKNDASNGPSVQEAREAAERESGRETVVRAEAKRLIENTQISGREIEPT